MKLLFDFLPIILFFVTYKFYGDFYLATVVIIVATSLQIGWLWWRHGKVEKMPLITLALVVVFGGATLLLQEEIYLKWKPTVVNWLFAVVFFGSHFIGKKPLIARMLGAAMTLPGAVWARLNLAWTLFFVTMGVVNLFVVYRFDTDTWVNFKLYGMLGLTVVFVILQGLYLARYVEVETETNERESDG